MNITYKTKVLGRFTLTFEQDGNATLTNLVSYCIPGFKPSKEATGCYGQAIAYSELERWLFKNKLVTYATTYGSSPMSYVIFKPQDYNAKIISVK